MIKVTASDPDTGAGSLITYTMEVSCIGLDKSGYQVNSFLISQEKHMVWVLIRSALVRCF